MLVNGCSYEASLSEKRDKKVLDLLKKVNNFYIQGLKSKQGRCKAFMVGDHQVGFIRQDVARYLQDYSQVFITSNDSVTLNPKFDTFLTRSEAIDKVVRDLREKRVLLALKAWREEPFFVWKHFGTEPLFQIERSAIPLFGIRSFGAHVTGYTFHYLDGSIWVWLQRRSTTKPTWPGMLDSMVGGGITAGLTPFEVMIKEAYDEASIPEVLAATSSSSGTVSMFTEIERGLHANTEFVYDLELPWEFIPSNSDGEVDNFYRIPAEELVDKILSPDYKLTSVPVAVDFLIRHGIINPDNQQDVPLLQELLHVPLNQIFSNF